MKQEDFAVEQYMDKYETGVEFNLGETCVDSLSLNEVFQWTGDESKHQFVEDLLDTKLVYGYIKGSDRLKNAIANVYNKRLQDSTADASLKELAKISNDDIVITNGAIGGNFLAFYSLVNTGDKVIAVTPSYQQLTSVPNMFSGGNLIEFELKPQDNYQPDLQQLEKLVEEHSPKLLVINNPHNPTGAVWENTILDKIVEICKRKNTYILCDEVYAPLFHSIDHEAPRSITSFGYDNTISSGSMSKAFSLAGVRLGWLVSKNKTITNGLFSKRDYNTISVSMADDKISAIVLEQYQKILERNYKICTDNLKIVELFVQDLGDKVSWIKPTGGSTCFIQFHGIDTLKMCEELATKHKTLMVPGEVFQKPGFCRVGFGNSRRDIQGGLQVVKNYVMDADGS